MTGSGRPSATGRWWRRLMVAGTAAAALTVGAASPAQAHTTLRSASPAADSTVARTPAQVVLTFNEPALALGTRVVVTGPAGPVQTGDPELVDTKVSQALQAGAPAGRYRVDWRITSADGHPISGSYSFTSAGAPSGTPPPADVPPPPTVPPVPGAPIGIAAALLAAGLIAVNLLRRRRRIPSHTADPEGPRE